MTDAVSAPLNGGAFEIGLSQNAHLGRGSSENTTKNHESCQMSLLGVDTSPVP